MEIKFSKERIEFEKEFNELDKFTFEFCDVMNRLEIKYVVVSGYVSILFGRNRSSEDIDLIVEKISFEKFNELWLELYKKFECLNTENIKDAYEDYLLTNHSIRFSLKNKFVPNMEFKFPKTDLDKWTLENNQKVLVNNQDLTISKIELQISFKLFLGSEKDIEDARYLYELFEENLDKGVLNEFNSKLNIEESFNKYIK